MKPSEYEFNIGDKVITTYGEVGVIVDICKCEMCVKRGFYEPTWVEDGRLIRRYITNCDATDGFSEYYQIGKYKFNSLFNKGLVTREIAGLEKRLAKYKKMLAVIEELSGERERD